MQNFMFCLYNKTQTNKTSNAKLLQQMKAGSKRTISLSISISISQTKVSVEASNQYLDYLFDSRFQDAKKICFILWK